MPRPNYHSIRQFREYRAAKTLPPPPGKVAGAELRAAANDIRRMAAKLLAEANDLDAAAEAMEKL